MTHSNRAVRPAGRSDHSVLVIAFMMALVFIPVLAMHATAAAVSPAAALEWVTGGSQAAKAPQRVPS